MKQFAITTAAVFVGGIGALLLYDALVLKPREAALTETLTASAKVDFARARSEAKGIAEELDTVVDQSVADARRAMAQQASEQDRRRLATDAVNRAAMFKVAIAESYLSSGKWPGNATEAGLGPPESYAGSAVASIEVGTEGLVIVTLVEPFAQGSKIRLKPTVNPTSYVINWQCSTEGDPQLPGLLPGCEH